MDAAILSHVLESHDRLIGVIDVATGLARLNARAGEYLPPGPAGEGSDHGAWGRPVPRSLADAAVDARDRGILRRGILVKTLEREVFLHGHFWPMDQRRVGFALRADERPDSAEVASALDVPRWQAQQALSAAAQLTLRDIVEALSASDGDVSGCIRILVAAQRKAAAAGARSLVPHAGVNLVAAAPPAALARGGESGERESLGDRPQSTRVLCVVGEGEEDFGERVTAMIEQLGHAPTRVATAQDARESLALTKPYFQTVLLNLDMPAYAALELASDIRTRYPETRLSFYTAGGASEDTVERARRLGPVLPRPSRADGARRAVEHARPAEPPPGRQRFAIGSRSSMRLRAILTALRRSRKRGVGDADDELPPAASESSSS